MAGEAGTMWSREKPEEPVSWYKLSSGPGEPFWVMEDRPSTQVVRQWCLFRFGRFTDTLAAWVDT